MKVATVRWIFRYKSVYVSAVCTLWVSVQEFYAFVTFMYLDSKAIKMLGVWSLLVLAYSVFLIKDITAAGIDGKCTLFYSNLKCAIINWVEPSGKCARKFVLHKSYIELQVWAKIFLQSLQEDLCRRMSPFL